MSESRAMVTPGLYQAVHRVCDAVEVFNQTMRGSSFQGDALDADGLANAQLAAIVACEQLRREVEAAPEPTEVGSLSRILETLSGFAVDTSNVATVTMVEIDLNRAHAVLELIEVPLTWTQRKWLVAMKDMGATSPARAESADEIKYRYGFRGDEKALLGGLKRGGYVNATKGRGSGYFLTPRGIRVATIADQQNAK